MRDLDTLALVGALGDRALRSQAAQALAAHCGGTGLMVFVADRDTGTLVPGPGFAATLPGGRGWRQLLAEARVPGTHRQTVRGFEDQGDVEAVACAYPGIAVVFLGGSPEPCIEELAAVAPLLRATFQAEQAAFVTAGQLRVATQASGQASALAAALEQARQHAERLLVEQADAAHFNEMFVGILGHDLRNPLGAILTAAQLMLRRNPDEKTVRPLTRILSSGERMARMIEQLLDFTRARIGGGIPLSHRDIDLEPLIRQIVDEEELAATGWAFDVSFDGDRKGSWDPDRLAQVFSNLISNAVRHGSPSKPLRLAVDGRQAAFVDITVHNVGTIPPPVLPALFDPFRGTRSVQGGSQGLGLGLFISAQVIKAHGGEIRVDSSPDAGTTFSIRLPRGVDEFRQRSP
jgi:signal transduction histidine kinase